MPYSDSHYERSWKRQARGVTLHPVKVAGRPWYCHVQTAVAEESDGEYGDATCITTVSEGKYARSGNRGDLIAWVPHGRRHLANARLIAAAPILLATLQRLQSVFEALDDWRNLDATYVDQLISSEGLLACDRAIAKAEGRSE